MRIGVIGAMQIEIDNLKKSLENSTTEEISSVQFVKGNIGEVEVVAAVFPFLQFFHHLEQ